MIAMVGLAMGLVAAMITGQDQLIQMAIIAGLSGVGVTTAATQSKTTKKE